jgi:hypothetical protein
MVRITRLDLVDRFLETDDRRILPIAHFFDARGRETPDHQAAVLCIAGSRGQWLSVKLKHFSRASLQ